MYISRQIEEVVLKGIKNNNKIRIIFGPRQTGKTTFCKKCMELSGLRTLYLNADASEASDLLTNTNLSQIKLFVQDYDLIIIDEAQRIPEIGFFLNWYMMN